MIDHTSFTQSDERSRAFQISPTRPRGRSTRANSPKARSASNQWNAWATVIASRDRGAIGSASATAATDGDAGHGGDEPSAHPLDRLRREHRRAGRHEQSRELARSRPRGRARRRRARARDCRPATPPRRRGTRDGPVRTPRPRGRNLPRRPRGRPSRHLRRRPRPARCSYADVRWLARNRSRAAWASHA